MGKDGRLLERLAFVTFSISVATYSAAARCALGLGAGNTRTEVGEGNHVREGPLAIELPAHALAGRRSNQGRGQDQLPPANLNQPLRRKVFYRRSRTRPG